MNQLPEKTGTTSTPTRVGEQFAPESLARKFKRKLPLNLLRVWWVLGLVVAVAFGGAYVGSKMAASTSWMFRSTILYTQIPIESAAEGLYNPPDLKTMSKLVTSPVILQRVCEELELGVRPREMSKLITIDEPKSMQRVGVQLDWSDPEQGREVLDKMTEVFGLHISEIRRNVVSGYLHDLNENLERNGKRLGTSQETLRQFNNRANVQDAQTELVQLLAAIGALETEYSAEKRRIGNLQVQHKSVEERLRKQTREANVEAQEQKESDALEESLADRRRRQTRLNELIDEERRLNEIRGALSIKQQEFDRKLKLYEKDYISRAEFDQIDAEVKALKSKIIENSDIEEWKQELEQIDESFVPKPNNRRIVSPIIHQTLFKLVELDLDILSANTEMNQIQVELVEKRRKVVKLQEVEQESTQLRTEIDAATTERNTINEQLAALQAIHDYGPHEFSVVAPATNAMDHPSSNRAKLFILMFGGLAIVLSSPFVLHAMLLSLQQTIGEGCTDRGISVLSPQKSVLAMLSEGAGGKREMYGWARHVALRFQQLLPQKGGVVSIFPSTHRRADVELIAEIATVLTDRDERVLIVESSAPRESDELTKRRQFFGQEPEADYAAMLHEIECECRAPRPGLFDYLHGDIDTTDHLIAPSCEHRKFDYISVGKHNGRFDRLFSKQMNQLSDEVRRQYSIIFMYGPELQRTVDVELQTRHSDGVVILHDRGELSSHASRTTLDSLIELVAPIWGTVIRPRGFAAPERPRLITRVLCQLSHWSNLG